MTQPTGVYETMRDTVDEMCCAGFCLDQLARVAAGDAVTPEELESAELAWIVDAADLGKFLTAKLNRLRLEADRLGRMIEVIDLGELWHTLRARIDASSDPQVDLRGIEQNQPGALAE